MIKNTIIGLCWFSTVSGGVMHLKYDFLLPMKYTYAWIQTPEDLEDLEDLEKQTTQTTSVRKTWNKGFFWHKFTVLKYGLYESKYLNEILSTKKDATDKDHVNNLINYCHSKRNEFNWFFNAKELKKIEELCYLEHQETNYKKFIDIWNWEYKNNARIILISRSENKSGWFLSFAIDKVGLSIETKNTPYRSKVDLILEWFHRWKANLTGVQNKYLQNNQNTKRYVPIAYIDGKILYENHKEDSNKDSNKDITFITGFQDSLV